MTARSPASPAQADAADALLTPRDTDGTLLIEHSASSEDAEPAPEERALVRHVRAEGARARRRRRGIALVVASFALLVLSLILTHRPTREPELAPVSSPGAVTTPLAQAPSRPDDESEARGRPAPSLPEPPTTSPERSVDAPVGAVELPERPPRPRAGSTRGEPVAPRLIPPREQWREPAALPSAVARRPALDVRARVTRAANHLVDGAVDYTVRLSDASGEPIVGADVRLRGVMADGVLVEARLDSLEAPGVYHGLVTISPRGPRHLTLRVARADGVVEMPLGETPPSAIPPAK